MICTCMLKITSKKTMFLKEFRSSDCITIWKIFVNKVIIHTVTRTRSLLWIFIEPCPPGGVMVNASCKERSALVSWTPSLVAETYQVVATAADGYKHTCNTTSSNCSLSELHCDQQYMVFVTASHENCSSKASQSARLNTGVCSQTCGTSAIKVTCSDGEFKSS